MLQPIKHQFFTYRNGELADTLRKAGMNYRMIFGLQIPQIAQIARSLTPSLSLAQALWDDKDVRESRLLATYLFPPEEISEEKALELSREAQTREEADMLAFRLFKRLPFAGSLLKRIEEDLSHPFPYCAAALRNHIG